MSGLYQLHKSTKQIYVKGDIVIINLVSDQPVKRYVIEILERCTFEKGLDLHFYEDFSRVMKPYLDNGFIRILGLATERTYQKQTQLKRLVE